MESNQKSGGTNQNRLEARQILENYEGSIISSIMSAKPSESGYGSASTTSGQDKSKNGSGSGTVSSKSKSLGSDSASAGTNNGSEDYHHNKPSKELQKRRFKYSKSPSPDATLQSEVLEKAEDTPNNVPQNPRSSIKEARALQAVALTRALDCIQKISNETDDVDTGPKRASRGRLNPEAAKKVAKEVKMGLKEKGRDWRALLGPDIVTDMSQSFAFLEKDPSVKRKESFIAALSLESGCVVYVTSSLEEKLFFHCGMWTGRNLLDFLHPKDRLVFTNYVTSGLMGAPGSAAITSPDSGDVSKPSLCVRFRQFKSLKTFGFSVMEKKTSYLPFKLNLKLHRDTKENNDESDDEMFILVHAIPIKSAYSHSDQTFSTGKFSLRHNSASNFNEVDPASIPLLGHMPQDLIGISALDFYHPSDLAVLRDTYSAVIKRRGQPIRSMPYQFKAQNGCYVLLETDWSCFVNPWSKKLEFVVGNHKVVKGPSNPDVFASPSSEETDPVLLSDDARKIVSDITNMLGGAASSPKRPEPGPAVTSDHLSYRHKRRELAILMGSLLDEVTRVQMAASPRSNSPGSPLCDLSAVIGDISPHRGASPESSDTPMSYGQLNYNENIERYFQSQQKLLPSDSSEEKRYGKLTNASGGSKESTEPDRHQWKQKDKSTGNEGESSLPVIDNQSQLLSSEETSATGSGSHCEPRPSASKDKESCYGPELTTELLRRHNAAMEHDFLEQMKVCNAKNNMERVRKARRERSNQHGIKRSIGSSWGNGSGENQNQQKYAFREAGPINLTSVGGYLPVGHWPAFSLPTGGIDQPNSTYTFQGSGPNSSAKPAPMPPGAPPMVPAYYVSHQQHDNNGLQIMHPVFVQPNGNNMGMPYVGGMVAYQPVYLPQQCVVPSMPFVSPVPEERNSHPSSLTSGRVHCSSGIHRCDSQATSYKAEPPDSHAPSYDSCITRKEVGATYTDGELPVSEDRSVIEELAGGQSEVCPWSGSYDAGLQEAEDICHRVYDSELSDGSSNSHWATAATAAQPPPAMRRTPPWMESVESTPDLVYRYQVPEGPSLEEILERDMAALQQMHQPTIVNDQLFALYREFEAEDSRIRLHLEEGDNTTSSGEEAIASHKRKARRRDDFRRSMIYEENAFPRP
ncbi:period circadian protein-like isoform X2 [Artemia franciscana]|uniref:period circadian protein-like isoform X2 n=1 Tax=Artemia franciscana TaxID=6661 RepID=UPI0032DB8BB9